MVANVEGGYSENAGGNLRRDEITIACEVGPQPYRARA